VGTELREVDQYIYANPLTRSLTEMGHWACSGLTLSGGRVLDLGCGSGRYAKRVRSSYLGVDHSGEMVKKASCVGSVVRADAGGLPFRDDSIPVVVASGLLEHLPNLAQVLVEVRRILVEGGELIVLQPCENLLYRLGRRMTTARHARSVGIDYPRYLKREHIWTCTQVLEIADQVLTRDLSVGIPFGIPVIGVNVYVAVRYTKKRQ